MRRAPLESKIENVDLDYGSNGIPRKHKPEVKVKIDLCKVWRWWKRRRGRKQEEEGYGYAYECGCSAKAGACSDPYCSVHGMRLMRFKKKEPHSIKRTVVLLIGLPIL